MTTSHPRPLRAWVVSADMGLGHQRAAHGLAHLAEGGIITAGNPAITTPEEVRFWRRLTGSYELLSRMKGVPLIGSPLFGLLNGILAIPPFYPLRDLSHPSPNNLMVDRLVKQGLGRSLIEHVRMKPLPMIATFYAAGHVADRYLDTPIYCVICDADLNRVWVASRPKRSRIQYFAPCGRVMRRLREYGVPDERIFITGFPLPRENIGGPGMETLKWDMLARLGRLDPRGRFSAVYGPTVASLLGASPEPTSDRGAVTVTFAVGGAGAQVEIGNTLATALKPGIVGGRFRLVLIAGVRRPVERAFLDHIARIGLEPQLGNGVVVMCEDDKAAYFDRFNALMRKTDILWTKPSELSFLSALGIPIVTAPTIGAQEDKNLKWLTDKGCAIPQYTPSLALEWLTDLLKDGVFAERALNGFVKNRKLGVYKVEEVLATGTMTRETHPLKR